MLTKKEVFSLLLKEDTVVADHSCQGIKPFLCMHFHYIIITRFPFDSCGLWIQINSNVYNVITVIMRTHFNSMKTVISHAVMSQGNYKVNIDDSSDE